MREEEEGERMRATEKERERERYRLVNCLKHGKIYRYIREGGGGLQHFNKFVKKSDLIFIH